MKHIYDVKKVANLIKTQFPDFPITSIKVLGYGMDCEVFVINYQYAFKFPKHAKANQNLQREKTILSIIENKVTLPVPKIVFSGTIPENGFMFLGYEEIKGTPLNRKIYSQLSNENKEKCAKDIAEFLKSLHGIKVTNIDSLVLHTIDKYKHDLEFIKRYFSEVFGQEIISKINDFYYDLFNTTKFFDYSGTIIHNDFSMSNVFFDTKENKICGIIDFSDTAFSDPDNDFYYLLENSNEELGKEFGLKVLNYYEHQNIEMVCKKASFYQLYWMFDQLIFGKIYNDKKWIKHATKKINDYFK